MWGTGLSAQSMPGDVCVKRSCTELGNSPEHTTHGEHGGVALSALERVCVCLQTVTPVNDDAWTGLSQGALTAALAVQSARRRLRTQLSVPFLSPCPGVSLHMPHR